MKTTIISSLLALGLVGSAQAAVVYTQDFESGTPAGWDMQADGILAASATSVATITSVDLGLGAGASNALTIATGGPYQVVTTQSFDLSTASTATIEFDYGDEDGGGTRFSYVRFWDGTSWVDLSGKVTHNVANQHVSYTITTGFAADNKFMFEGKNGGGGGTKNTYFDNVVLTADVVVPEPSAALLGGLGFLLLLRRRRA